MTHELLWPNFQAMWPLTQTPGGGTTEAMPAWGLPFLNTVLLVSSSITLTIAHHALVAGQRNKLLLNLFITLVLGFAFLFFQPFLNQFLPRSGAWAPLRNAPIGRQHMFLF